MKKSLFIILIGLLLFAVKSFSQCQGFSIMELSDKYGKEVRKGPVKICLLSGKIEVTQGGFTWTEDVTHQTKGAYYIRATTSVGEYTILLEQNLEIESVYFKALAGADVLYKNLGK